MSQASLDISRLVVFGDSLSDNGNLFKLTASRRPRIGRVAFPMGRPTPSSSPNCSARISMTAHSGEQTASNSSPGVLLDPLTGTPLPINLPEAVGFYLAQLHGHRAPADTAAVIYIGNNDYINYLESDLPKIPQTALELVSGSRTKNISRCDSRSPSPGVEKIALSHAARPGSPPEFSGAWTQHGWPFSRARHAQQRGVQAIGREIRPNVQLVDIFQLLGGITSSR